MVSVLDPSVDDTLAANEGVSPESADMSPVGALVDLDLELAFLQSKTIRNESTLCCYTEAETCVTLTTYPACDPTKSLSKALCCQAPV